VLECDVGPFEGSVSRLKILGYWQNGDGFTQDLQRSACQRCSMNTNFQLFIRRAVKIAHRAGE